MWILEARVHLDVTLMTPSSNLLQCLLPGEGWSPQCRDRWSLAHVSCPSGSVQQTLTSGLSLTACEK